MVGTSLMKFLPGKCLWTSLMLSQHGQAISHYLSQCWPRSLLPYDVTRPQWVKTHRSRNKMANILLKKLRRHFLEENFHILIPIWLKYVKWNSMTINQHWFVRFGLPPNRWQAIKSLWPSDAIWRQKSGSTLAQVMACCLTAPSHYLNQCWLIISKVKWYSSDSNFTRDNSAINHWN